MKNLGERVRDSKFRTNDGFVILSPTKNTDWVTKVKLIFVLFEPFRHFQMNTIKKKGKVFIVRLKTSGHW